MKHKKDIVSTPRSIRVFIRITYLVGLLLPSVLGLIIRELLAVKGIPVVSLLKGAQLVLILTFFFFLPYAVLALFANDSLTEVSMRSQFQFRARLYIYVGVLFGMTASLGCMLVYILPTIGEEVALLMALWPIPFAILGIFLCALGGSLIGAVIGRIIWHIAIHRYRTK